MKRLVASLAAGLFAGLSGLAIASTTDLEVPNSETSAGPALAAFGDRLVVAWAGESGIAFHRVWYSTFDGTSFTAQSAVPGALTTSAPALAVAGGKLYLATTPPNTDDDLKELRRNAQFLELVSALKSGVRHGA